MKTTISICTTGDCNLNCQYCVAGLNRNKDNNANIDFDTALEWVNKYYPKSRVHFGGGEPLMNPDLGEHIEKFLDAGHTAAIFTNTTMIPSREDLHGLDIEWQVSHHAEAGVSFEQFLKNIEGIRHRDPLAVRVFFGSSALNNRLSEEQKYTDAGLRFSWLNYKGGYRGFDFDFNQFSEHPNESILMIDPHGNISNCSNPNYGFIGSIFDDEFDKSKLTDFACPSGGYPHDCQACQSTIALSTIMKTTQTGESK